MTLPTDKNFMTKVVEMKKIIKRFLGKDEFLIPIERFSSPYMSFHRYDLIKVYTIAKSIEKEGLQMPLKVILKNKNRTRIDEYNEDCQVFISEGYHRFLALKMLGWKMIPCIVL